MHSSFVHEHWGASPFSFRTLALDLFVCFSPFGDVYIDFILLQSLDPQYSLISSNYSLKRDCHHFYGGTHIILAL